MKKLVIGLFVLGLANQGFSQNVENEVELVTLEDITLYNLNVDYLNEVQDKVTSIHVKDMEIKASTFDVSELPEFDGRKELFKTVFKNSKGQIVATYDNKGKILSTSEKYHDIKMPVPVRQTLFKEFPNCSVNEITYMVSYNGNSDIKKVYDIKIKDDNSRRNLKIDSEGNRN